MVGLSVLSTLGVGGIVATHSVYLSEMTRPTVRNQVLLASQGSHGSGRGRRQPAGLRLDSGTTGNAFVWAGALIEIVVLLPLL